MPRLQGPHIFSEAGLCRKCARPQAEHRPIACGYPRKDYEHRTPCDGICMYRKNPEDGLLVCCSVCPHCGIPPIDDPNDECEEEGDVPHEHQLGACLPEAPGQNGEAATFPIVTVSRRMNIHCIPKSNPQDRDKRGMPEMQTSLPRRIWYHWTYVWEPVGLIAAVVIGT